MQRRQDRFLFPRRRSTHNNAGQINELIDSFSDVSAGRNGASLLDFIPSSKQNCTVKATRRLIYYSVLHLYKL